MKPSNASNNTANKNVIVGININNNKKSRPHVNTNNNNNNNNILSNTNINVMNQNDMKDNNNNNITTDDDDDDFIENEHFNLNLKGYVEFNSNLIIDSRYQLQNEIILDTELGTTAKGRYGSVFRVKDLKDGSIKALKINRIPPQEEDAKRQAAKEQLKKQQQKHLQNRIKNGNFNNNTIKQVKPQVKTTTTTNRRKTKTVQERYKSSCKREIGVLKRITRKNQNQLIPCLILYDYGEYLGHTYMIFPIYDQTLQQHLINIQRYQDELHSNTNNECNALIHPNDLWAFLEQLISALSYVHNICNVMHLDFKPKNIMINRYQYNIQQYHNKLNLIKLKKNNITLIDFSVSAKAPKKANLDEVRYTGNFGTRRYRPPEMIYGGKWNRSVDTYGTAMIILESIKLYPIIDTTYYKKKKILKYKKRLKKLQSLKPNIKHKIDSSYKQLDIWEVLYLIIQQIGFPQYNYWLNLNQNEKYLFPPTLIAENITKKGKKSKLFDNDAFDINNINNITANNAKNVKKKKKNKKKIVKNNNNNNNNNDYGSDTSTSSSNSSSSSSSSTSSSSDGMSWNSFSNKLTSHRGIAWNLFKLYGSDINTKFRLDIMEQSLKKMVKWDPRKRITPEQVLKIYFPTNTTHSNDKYYNDLDDDD